MVPAGSSRRVFMATAPEAPQIVPSARTRWLWVARVAAILWLLVVIAFLLKGGQGLGLVIFAIALAAVLVGLFGKVPMLSLAWEVGIGSVMFFVAVEVGVKSEVLASRAE